MLHPGYSLIGQNSGEFFCFFYVTENRSRIHDFISDSTEPITYATKLQVGVGGGGGCMGGWVKQRRRKTAVSY